MPRPLRSACCLASCTQRTAVASSWVQPLACVLIKTLLTASSSAAAYQRELTRA